MATGYRGSAASGPTDNNVNPVIANKPSSAQPGDVALVAIEFWNGDDGTITLSPPAGFTEVINYGPMETFSGYSWLKVYWKRLGANEPASWSFGFTGGSDPWSLAHTVVLYGAAVSGDPVEVTSVATAANPSATVPTAGVTTASQPFLAHFVVKREPAGQTTPPVGFTEVQDGEYLTSNYSIPGATGAHTASGGLLDTAVEQIVGLVAVKPDAEPEPVPTAAGSLPLVVGMSGDASVPGAVPSASARFVVSVGMGGVAVAPTATVPVGGGGLDLVIGIGGFASSSSRSWKQVQTVKVWNGSSWS